MAKDQEDDEQGQKDRKHRQGDPTRMKPPEDSRTLVAVHVSLLTRKHCPLNPLYAQTPFYTTRRRLV
jgi:hypothetical protein